jgi:uncharacterized protein
MHATPNPIVRAAPWYTQRWPWLLMLGPAVVVVAGGYTAWLAVSRQDALVVGDYYKQGKAINQDLRRDRVASAMKLALHSRYDAANGKLEGQLDGAGVPVTAPFRLLLAHPTLPERDRSVLVVPGQDGRFSVSLPGLGAERWQVVAEGARRDWRLERSWDSGRQAEFDIAADKPD